MKKYLFIIVLFPALASAMEVALTFDDAPGEKTSHFTPEQRTKELLKKLGTLNLPSVIIFANPCNGDGAKSNYLLLKMFQDAGNIIGNHTCSHPNLNKVGFDSFTKDTLEAEKLLNGLMTDEKLFRFPFFQEGKDVALRDKVRHWLKEHKYKNISSSLENEDPIFSSKINEAKKLGNKIDYSRVKTLFLDHVLSGVSFYDKLAKEILGYSPKHIILLHDKDATVLFLEDLVNELRNRGWKIISAKEALKDPLYSMEPANVHSTNGLIGQLAFEKNGKFEPYYDFVKLKTEINSAVGIKR